MMVTLGDMAEALDRLRRKYGFYYTPVESVILREAVEFKRRRFL